MCSPALPVCLEHTLRGSLISLYARKFTPRPRASSLKGCSISQALRSAGLLPSFLKKLFVWPSVNSSARASAPTPTLWALAWPQVKWAHAATTHTNSLSPSLPSLIILPPVGAVPPPCPVIGKYSQHPDSGESRFPRTLVCPAVPWEFAERKTDCFRFLSLLPSLPSKNCS